MLFSKITYESGLRILRLLDKNLLVRKNGHCNLVTGSILKKVKKTNTEYLIKVSSSVVDPDPHRDGENGSGTDPGSIKRSRNKGDKFFF